MKHRKERHTKKRTNLPEKMERDHERLVERICSDPGLLTIDGIQVNPADVKAIRKGFWWGYKADIALLREPQPGTAEVDMIDVSLADYGKSIIGSYRDLGKRFLPFYEKNPKGFLTEAEKKLEFQTHQYKELWLDILISSIGPLGLVETERLPGYERRRII